MIFKMCLSDTCFCDPSRVNCSHIVPLHLQYEARHTPTNGGTNVFLIIFHYSNREEDTPLFSKISTIKKSSAVIMTYH